MHTLTEIAFEPEHYNRNCGCTIPEAWVGIIDLSADRGNSLAYTKIMGRSRQDILDIARHEGITIAADLVG